MALIYAIDRGTSSTRVLVFKASDWQVISQHQLEFNSIYPDEGWCEQDPSMILQTVKDCISGVTEDILSKGYKLDQVKAIGITNQRETTVAWHKTSGLPLQYFNPSWKFHVLVQKIYLVRILTFIVFCIVGFFLFMHC